MDLNASTLEMPESVDLGVISAFVEGVRASGALQADLVLAGPLTAPRLTGRFSMQGGRLRFVGFPQAFEGINLAAEVEDTKATLSTFTARLGGGEVQASGSATLTGFTPTQYTLQASGTRVRLTYPEGFTAVYSGNLTLEGTAEQSRLAGRSGCWGVYRGHRLACWGSLPRVRGIGDELLPEDVFRTSM